MNKGEIIKALAEDADLLQNEASVYVDTFFSSMRQALLNGDRVEIRGFGSFKVKQYKGYRGRNPKSGKSVDVAPKRLPIFRPGKELKDMVNT